MPIYAYRCATCGHAQDTLQKMSDPVLTVCPACGASTYEKQVTAAGFQLKGSGWYVTDFRDGNKAAAKKDDKPGDKAAETTPGDKAADKPADKPGEKATEAAKPAETQAVPAAAPAPPAPAPASGT
jgi:putative FmdB family regulatory protein